MTNKVKLQFKEKRGYDFIFADEEGNEQVCKIYKDKPFIDKLTEDSWYYCILNQNWINKVDPVDPEDDLIEELIDSQVPKDFEPMSNKQDVGRQIIIQHYSSDACRLLSTLWEAVDVDEKNYTNLMEEHEKIVRRLLTMHDKLLKEKWQN